MLGQLDDAGVPVLVLGEVPGYPNSFPRERLSVLRPSTAPPTRPSPDVGNEQVAVAAVERAAIDRDSQAVNVDAIPAFCDDECSTYRDGTWLYYGSDDLTVSGGRLLAPEIGRALDAVAPTG